MVVLYCPFWMTLVFPSYLHSFLLCKPEDLLKTQTDFFSDSYCVAFFYLTSRTTLHSHCFAWQQAKQRSPTFQFVVTRGPRDLVESTAINIKFLFAVRNGKGFFRHPDTRHKNTWLYFDVLLVKLKTLLLVNKTNRCTKFQFYWHYDSTCFGQPFCSSSVVLSRTSALVHFYAVVMTGCFQE